ncbi:hypothetical protein QBC46DRAFT_18411 [Diplogelasinospora grovesii]|uniref:Uncharacterized protein n=1 Tax=Diplogelasinospora grovesii TaxID=303347 RepID=A0AAN6N2P1_9PEZI|nr:hypothetical protein QBC46DRAFT_18411 [Diplogelasinospora grovesii]
MSISRAFTTRRAKQSLQLADNDKIPQRSNTTKGAVSSLRHKISGPVELIYTTNMLSYNAPDIHPHTASSISSSLRSDDEMSDSAPTTASSPPTSPDIPSSPKRDLSPEPNHLSCYFTPPARAITAPVNQPQPPVIPQRAPSHTKKYSETLVRQRSISRMSEQSHRTLSTKASFSFSQGRSSSGSTSTSATSHISTPPQHKTKASTTSINSQPVPVSMNSPPQSHYQHKKDFSHSQHPFGHELAQVSEIAEEYGVKDQLNVVEAEERELVARGLMKYSAEDYASEIQGLFATFFPEEIPVPVAMTWI